MGEHKHPDRSRVRVTLDGQQIGPFMSLEKARSIETWMRESGNGLVDWMETQVTLRFLREAESANDALVIQPFQDDSTALIVLRADLLTDTVETLKERIQEAGEKILAERQRLLERKP